MRGEITLANKKTVKAESSIPKFSVLGTYTGECADANITNLNGLDITRPVWENVFNSDEFKQGIDLGWYIGFLGHPEDPNCMDFEHACIVMREGNIDSDGKVQGKFDLIDTPVGRIVKAFQDAGVTFGISVRGAGDIVDNSVDPDTFVFRGFDLVTFPAFPESIPTFSEVAASTDLNQRAKYKAVCAAVNENLDSITMSESLDIIQSQFAEQSDEYKALEAHKREVCEEECKDDDMYSDGVKDLDNERINAMTNLYLREVECSSSLKSENTRLRKKLSGEKVRSRRKISSIERITSSQLSDIQSNMEVLDRKYQRIVKANKVLENKIKSLENSNLKYKQKISASSSQLQEKDATISHLRIKLNETVTAASNTKKRTSNLDAQNRDLQKEIEAAYKMIASYQEAYASMYSHIIGVNLDHLDVNATTSVEELQKLIGGTSTANISSVFVEPQPVPLDIDDYEEDDMVTL